MNAEVRANHDYKARGDMVRCLACRLVFGSDDIRSNVYNDNGCIGAIHDYCYLFLGGPAESAPIRASGGNHGFKTRSTDDGTNRQPSVVGVTD